MTARSIDDLPRWVLAVGPVVVLTAVFGLLYLTSPFSGIDSADGVSTVEIVWTVTIIGAIAGIIPVAIGMLWFPFIRNLEPRYLHAFMALAAGVLVFIAIEMIEEIVEYSAVVDSTLTSGTVAVVGVGGTFAVMYVASKWRQNKMASQDKSGLHIAYLVALALGLHSIGEGLGIGVAYVQGDASLVMLLVLAFVMHNVMEGPTIVAAVARERETPPVRHFAMMGVIAGAPVILGGWVGSFANSPLLAMLFYAIAVGAIIQVLIEVAELIRFDAEAVLSRTNTATFVGGFVLMFFLEDVLTEFVLEGWLIPV
ncbi:ZIP family metal transporter [Natronorubrum sulfidifaciens]|uniref:Zinc transporter n=1 Tax=Natronorubrum sulfidifaciens JCM 14089 TaxID=1230460 RepID=L9WFF5_9EURY|nr:zinc transporter [Natronorubrum sulfidifaciens]ELY48092.1 zinc transporter [Natronorubrum sulfidifaciens JCM 14089]